MTVRTINWETQPRGSGLIWDKETYLKGLRKTTIFLNTKAYKTRNNTEEREGITSNISVRRELVANTNCPAAMVRTAQEIRKLSVAAPQGFQATNPVRTRNGSLCSKKIPFHFKFTWKCSTTCSFFNVGADKLSIRVPFSPPPPPSPKTHHFFDWREGKRNGRKMRDRKQRC